MVNPAHENLTPYNTGVSYIKTTGDGRTYTVSVEQQKSSDLLRSLSNCYKAHDKETQLSDLLAKSITNFLLNRNDDLLHDAIRRYREARPSEDSTDDQ